MRDVRSTRRGTNVVAAVVVGVVAGHPPTAVTGTPPATTPNRRPRALIPAATGGACRYLFPDAMVARWTTAADAVVDHRTLRLAPALALVAETIPIRDVAVMVATNGVGNHPLLHRATRKSGVIRKQGERRGLGHHRRYARKAGAVIADRIQSTMVISTTRAPAARRAGKRAEGAGVAAEIM